MASISSILSYDTAVDERSPAPESTAYTRASSTASFPAIDDPAGISRSLTPSTVCGTTPSCHASPAMPAQALSPSLAAILPADASAAVTAAAATATANRRRKVLTSRPPNSFILYRSDKLRELVQSHPELKQTQISKMCADNWKNEAPEVKDYYRQKQQEAKALFLSEQALEVERISGGASDKTIIKRIQPTNTFIRYRTEMKKKLVSQFATMNQKDVSRACGLMWRSEPESVKLRYRQSYSKEKRDFERLCSSSVLDEQPSMEALSALASVIAEATKTSRDAAALGALSAAASKKRRLSEGCHSAPVSPPQPEPKDHVRSKRLRSFHTPTRTILSASSPIEPPQTMPSPQAPISLPSCASLLSMAGTSPFPAPSPARPYTHARTPSALARPMPLPYKQSEYPFHHACPPPYYAHYAHSTVMPPPTPAHMYAPPPSHYHPMTPPHQHRVQN
ncbi:hypothetical protein LPJ61_005295 [Coemansia biformis]|uniref:HMG box domain-containing protein n=1 Tax=Coemansia biformis TaxID=1286918 RepID=A0A9W7Y9E2_9FUNG|nr:hypothetical protein LPJ61_005295 [Coemansia biformis]